MKIRTLVVSRYSMFKEGLERVIDPSFEIVSHFKDIPELLAAEVDADLAILDEESSSDLGLLKTGRPSLAILKLSLEDNTGCLYANKNNGSNEGLLKAVRNLASGISVIDEQA